VTESARDVPPGAFWGQAARDAAYGVRLWRKAPGFAAASVTIVAVGIAAVTTIFSVVHGIVLRPLPYARPERLVTLWTVAPRLGLARNPGPVSAADHHDWRRANHVFEDVALVRPIANFNLLGEGEPERLFGARVSPSLFRVLGVVPALGRTFTDDEDVVGNEKVVLLSHGLWMRRFGGDPAIVGRAIDLSGVRHTVVGVMRPEFDYPGREFQVWTPLTIDPAELARVETPHNYLAVARLRPGMTLSQAQADMDAVAGRLARAYPASNRDVRVAVRGMRDDMVEPVRAALYVLLAAGASLLLIACLNLASLLAARAARRQREFSVRQALGASRGRLGRQAVAEVLPILFAGGALGVAAAIAAVSAFVRSAPASIPRIGSVGVDGPVLAFAATMIALTGVLAAVLPAAQAWRSDLTSAVGEGTRAAGGRRQSRGRRVLVAAQIALAVPLLAGAILLVRSFAALVDVDPGFGTRGIVTLHLGIPRAKYPRDFEVAAMCSRVLERVRALPGVSSAAFVNRLPLGGLGQISPIEFEGVTVAGVEAPVADTRVVSPGYFATMGIPLRDGRDFDDRDGEGSPAVGIVDDRVARALWPGGTALGKRFRIQLPGLEWVEVVGVVGHIHNDALDVDARPQVYWPYPQRAQDRMVLVVRGDEPRSLLPSLVGAVRAVDPDQPVYDVRTMDEVLARSLSQRRLTTVLLAVLALVSLFLASVGLYGVIALGVVGRRREFGIRLALGARRGDVTRLVLREGAVLAAAGTLAGLIAAVALGGAMKGLLFGVAAGDAANVAGAPLVLGLVALAASYIPARRAGAVDPATTLRSE
jgi:putative ABC transport system permease protein